MIDSPAVIPRLSDRQRLHWLRLIRSDNVGPATFRDLINRFGSAEIAIEMLPELALRGRATRLNRIPTEKEAEAELETAQRFGARFVAIGEADYPAMLRRMDLPPPLIAIKGRADVFKLPTMSIVGARNSSLTGMRLARKIAHELGREGYAIASGLARGIDTAAHEGSLETGTIAVLAGGLDRLYPPENENLFHSISERGALITEMPFGWEPRARDFPRRNRLVAGLGLGLLVVEATKRSGSLISARLANEMGRIVFAIPGSPLDPRSAGTNSLLKEGATLVTETKDIFDALAPLASTPLRMAFPLEEQDQPPIMTPPPDDNDRTKVLEALGPVPVHIDALIRHTGLHTAQIMTILLELDLAGRLERHSGSSVSLLFDI